MNAEFQGISRRDKKALLSEQCKEIEENNRMGKTRHLKKIRDAKRIFHAKMGSIKDRNGIDLTEAKLLRRGGKNTQKNYRGRFVTLYRRQGSRPSLRKRNAKRKMVV